MAGGLLFAQLVTVAHACTRAIAAPEPATQLVQRAENMNMDCPATKCVAASATVCESHCTYGQQIDIQPHAPVAAIAPQPGLTIRVVPAIVSPSPRPIFLQARSTAPAFSLLFGRFLA